MKKTFIKESFLTIFATLFCVAASFGQTSITTGAVTPNSVCAGSDVDVAFTTDGTVLATTTFAVQLSGPTGVFGSSPEEIGSGKTSPIKATIAGETAAGSGYKVRVIAKILPAIQVTGSESAVLTINAIPATPSVVTPVNYAKNASAVALSATPATGLLWYTDATTGTGSATAPVPSTGTEGTISYWVSQKVGTCESPRAKIDVIVTCTAPPKPTVTSPVNYTVNDPAIALVATPSSGGTINWYGTNATGGTASSTAPKPSTAAAGTTTYYVSQTIGTCESERAQIIVTVNACTPPAKPAVTSPVTYTVGDAATFLLATPSSGGTINWYGTNATGGTASPTAPKPSTATAGTTTYYVSQTVGTCESERAQILVTVNACTPPAKPAVTSPVTYNLGQSAVALKATASGGGKLNWYGTNATGGTPSTVAPTPSTSSAGTTYYYVSQTIGVCESERAKIEVIVNCGTISKPSVVSPVTYTVGNTATALKATPSSGGTLNWYETSETGGTASTVAPTPATNVAGTTSYYVSQSIGGCESERAKIDVTINCNVVAKPTVATPLNLCQNSTAAPLTAVGTSLKWYTSETGGGGGLATITPSTSTVGSTFYYVSQTSPAKCESARTKLEVVIKDTPPAPTVTTPINYCVGETPKALTPSGAAYKWYLSEDSNSGSINPPVVTTTKDSRNSYYVTQSNTYGSLSCESPRSKVEVNVNVTPAAVSALSKEFCQERADKTYTFPTEASQGNTLKWYTVPSGGSAISTTPSINLKDAKETLFYVTQVTDKNCESKNRSIQKVLVKPLPGLPTIPQSLVEYCQFVAAEPLKASPVGAATIDWFGTNATGGTSSPAPPTPSTAEGGTTSYYVAQTLAGCLGDRAKIDVKINTTPKPTTKTYLEYCQNATAPALDATGTILKWYREANGTDWQGVPFVPFTEKVQDYSFYVTQTGSNGCESPKEEIKIHIKSLPSATLSGNSTIDLGQSATINIKFTGDGPWKYVLSNGDTATTDRADHQVTVKPSTTTSYLITEVSNACGKGIPIGSAVVTVKIPTINSGSPSVSEVCAGKPFNVPFQQSGDFPAGNTFKLQVATENADAKFFTIASTATANSVSATFPDTTKGGTYFVRVISSGSNPAFTVKGSVSSITINASPLPVATLTGTQTILVGESADLKAEITGKSPWTFTLNNGTKDTLITANATPFVFKLAPKTTTTYAITKVTNGCGIGTGVGTARVQVDPILGVEPPAPADWAKVYPTVINGKCTVEVTGTISPKQAKIEVVDLNGRPRSTTAIKQQKTEVDFTNYPSGLYLLRIQNGNLNTVQRVMKP